MAPTLSRSSMASRGMSTSAGAARFASGGGVTAGIDFALAVVAEIAGEDIAKTIQLSIEYDPQPPFDAGSPERAGEAIVARHRAAAAKVQAEREAAVREAAGRLGER